MRTTYELSEPRDRVGAAHDFASAKGYSLTELLTVIAIVGIVSVISIPAFSRIIPQYRIRSAALDLQSAVKLVRQKAVSHRAPWRVTYDPDNNRYAIQRMKVRPTAAVPFDDPDNWFPVSRNGRILADADPIDWIVPGVDLRAGSVNQFKDVDGDGMREIIFSFDGEVEAWPTSGTTVRLTFTDLPEFVVAVDRNTIPFNRYAIRADRSGRVVLDRYKE